MLRLLRRGGVGGLGRLPSPDNPLSHPEVVRGTGGCAYLTSPAACFRSKTSHTTCALRIGCFSWFLIGFNPMISTIIFSQVGLGLCELHTQSPHAAFVRPDRGRSRRGHFTSTFFELKLKCMLRFRDMPGSAPRHAPLTRPPWEAGCVHAPELGSPERSAHVLDCFIITPPSPSPNNRAVPSSPLVSTHKICVDRSVHPHSVFVSRRVPIRGARLNDNQGGGGGRP